MRMKKLFFIAFVTWVGFLPFACGIGTTEIGEILSHPREYAGKEVTISGRVNEAFSLFVIRYYILQDDSGEIPVVTDRPLPVKGEKLKTKGIVKEAFSIGTKSALVVVESAQTK